jgi:hypothetical protein
MPTIFTDPAYKKSSTWGITSSNIGKTPLWGGFAPLGDAGIGVCYGIRNHKINFSVSTGCNTGCDALG